MKESLYQWQENLESASKGAILLSFLLLFFLCFVLFLTIDFFIFGALDFLIISFLSIIFSLLVTLPIFLYSYYKPESIASLLLKTTKEPIDKRVLDIVDKMKIAFGVKNVEVRVIDWPIINAMVISKKDKSFLFITKGAIEKLDDYELEAVLAHEFSHIVNKDSYYMTLGIIVGAVTVIISYFLIRVLPHILFSGKDNKRNLGFLGLIALILIIFGYILAILSPIIQKRLLSKFSKNREFLADANAVKVTKYPPALISALIKVAKENTKEYAEKHEVPKSFALFFFDYEDIETHPPVWQRVKKISETTNTPVDEKIIEELKSLQF
ncbi:MAG: M48 family metalloprotease [Candidatus Aenigmatarchaeota archaeon]